MLSNRRHRGRASVSAWFVLAALPVSVSALANSYHTDKYEDSTIRCSSTNTETLPKEVIERYGFTQDDSYGLLSCVAQRRNEDGQLENLSVPTKASYRSIGEARRHIDLKRVLDGDDVSRVGSYRVMNRAPIEFDVTMDLPEAGRVSFSFIDKRPKY